jgi:DNA-directed RNA polymerase subunit beta'
MVEELVERINEYSAISIRLASPEDIRSWSFGEVKKPETINYRTLKPEKDGLFCEKIFGPEKDWECSCGKYKGVKYKGIICDRCGVQITRSYERRKRMGHISLACPVGHIWFFKTIPSRMGAILDLKINQLERVIYYQDYVVTEIKDEKVQLKEGQLLTEDDYRRYKEKYRDGFEAEMGAQAIRSLLQKVDLRSLSEKLRESLAKTTSEQKYKDIVKRLIIIEKFLESSNKPEYMILTVIPVIPPDLRPLVMLESGVFATSDLNDLYRRLINRNNRLKKLIDLNAPEVIIRNEKRMLQQAVDALFDNTRCRRPVLASNNRPLKSLADIIKGKQGRFRENLLGKRVDYSARSVIVVGPELHLNQCGIPKRIALELYQPFVIRKLKEAGHVDSLRSAKKVIERKDENPVVWDILDEVIKDHPVMLNRAPTLHRMGIEAFQPVLVEGNAIHLHPLVCPPFNADFDGDQMAVHLPLSFEAQVEAKTLIMATQNIFSPSNGSPIISPTQDIILGLAYLAVGREGLAGHEKSFSSPEEAVLAFEHKKVHLQSWIHVRLPKGREVVLKGGAKEAPKNGRYRTTVGRILFNEILPSGMPFHNHDLAKKDVQGILSETYKRCGKPALIRLLDDIKALGFKSATLAGISFSKDDLKIPQDKPKLIKEAMGFVDRIEKEYQHGVITAGERYSQIVDVWINTREKVAQVMMEGLKEDIRDNKPYMNPINLMVSSGARGSQDQVRQLAGMRGLMAKPSGKIIETPILSNFREGLTILEYFSSTHGARKGLADTALKTADAGYLTRKLVDVAQNMVIRQHDCGTLRAVTKQPIYRGNKLEVPLWQALLGRTARQTITDVVTDEVIVRENELITEEIGRRIESMGYTKLMVRSALMCEAPQGLCALCYGMDLSTGRLVEQGLATGIIAAQSIGEPGTQLTMRTFHIGGMAIRSTEEPKVFSKSKGQVHYSNIKSATTRGGQTIVVNRDAEVHILDDKGRKLEELQLPVGSVLRVKDGATVKPMDVLAEWDPYNIPIICGNDGTVVFEDIIKGKTVQEERDPKSGIVRLVTIEHRGDLHPQVVIRDSKGVTLEFHPIPERAHIEVKDGETIKSGTILAKTPREVSGTHDITGGLPRVTELFEARSPKEPAVVSRIDGVVELGEKKRGRRTVNVRNPETSVQVPHDVPHGRHLRVRTGDRVKAGDALVEGPLVPKEILKIKGEEAVQNYLLQEVQAVYRSQNVNINDKHIEIMVAQMMRKVRIQNQGDTAFLRGMIVDRFKVKAENERIKKEGQKPATFEPLLLGISKAAIQSESFIAAASFQETTRVLTDAAISGKRDELQGLKENVIVGHLIPAGTGFDLYVKQQLKRAEVEGGVEEVAA